MREPLGEYTIEEVLGEGGSAIVYAARPRTADVALKVLRVDALTTPRQKERFLDEARLLAQVRHPNVVAVLDAGTLPDGRPFIAMPRLAGETLAARLARGPVPLLPALRLFEAIAEGVAAIHGAGLVHRDLKAENVFLTEDERPIVLDLGIAREAEGAPSTTTEDGRVRGTPSTMAPERFFGARASTASDVYELALLLYVMLVGALPWSEAADVDARLAARPPHTLVATVPRALSDAIMAALSTRIEKRPASVTALLASVRSAATSAGDPEPRRTSETPRREAPSAAPPSGPREEAALRGEPSPLDASPGDAPASIARPHTPAAPRSKSAQSPVALSALAAAAIGLIAAATTWRTQRAASAPPALVESNEVLIDASAPASASAPTPSLASSSESPAATASSSMIARAIPRAAAAVSAAASSSPGASSAAPADPLAPCRTLVDLYCNPDLVDPIHCAVSRQNLEGLQFLPVDQHARQGSSCQALLDSVKQSVKERLDKLHGRPTTHLGKVPDEVLDARFPGCSRRRRTLCAQGIESLLCRNTLIFIDTNANGTPAQQKALRDECGFDALQDKDERREFARLHDGGAP
jgi:serine/threonine protein kinase